VTNLAALGLAVTAWQTARTKEANSAVSKSFPQPSATLRGHTSSVVSAVFSPDGQRIVTASDDQTARVWNATSGQLLATLQGHTKAVWTAAFSPDGQRIVTASGDETARVFRVVTLSEIAEVLAR
jgi:WD40 repeat protein